MAVTTEKSTQVTNQDATPAVMNPYFEDGASVRYLYFKHTQGSSAGDDGSSAILTRIPAGQGHILKQLSFCRFTAFGSSRTLDIGLAAYTERDSDSVSAQTDVLEDGRDISSANAKGVALGTGTNAASALLLTYDSKAPIDVKAIVAGGTWPAGAVLEGWIACVPNKG